MRTQRHGFALVELVIALTITALLIAAVTGILSKYQRIYAALGSALQSAPARLDATTLMGADIRTMSTVPTATAQDSVFPLSATIGASTLCTATSRSTLILPPRTSDASQSLTSYITTPDADDIALIYQNAHWSAYPITSLNTRPSAPCTTQLGPIVSAQLATTPPLELTLASPLPNTPTTGTPIRFARLAKYNVYRASDKAWYIGYRRCTTLTTCDGVQPLIGPLSNDSSSSAPVAFRFFNTSGVRIPTNAPLAHLARVDITIYHAQATIPRINGPFTPSIPDSTVATFALRNAQ